MSPSMLIEHIFTGYPLLGLVPLFLRPGLFASEVAPRTASSYTVLPIYFIAGSTAPHYVRLAVATGAALPSPSLLCLFLCSLWQLHSSLFETQLLFTCYGNQRGVLNLAPQLNITSKGSPLEKKRIGMGYNFNIKGQLLLEIRGEKYFPLV